MHKALTQVAVDRLKPPASGQVEVFDRGYPGLALRLSYGGARTFVYFYRLGGRLRRMTLGTYPAISLAQAREAWRKARQDVVAGRDPSGRSSTDFESVARDWLKRDQGKNRSASAVERVVERVLIPAWGPRPIASITRRDIRDMIDSIVDRGSPIMAIRVHAYLHRLFRWAVGRDIVESNPAADIPKPREKARERVLTDEELAAVWNAASKIGWPFGDATRLLILTGARREEVRQLRWAEIQDDIITLAGERTKNGVPHTIPLSAATMAIMDSIPRIAGSPWVFSPNGRVPFSGWSREKAKLDEVSGVRDWRIHDIRRTVATDLQKLGVNLQTIEAVLGHTSGSRAGVVGIYQRHSFDAEKRAALEAWGEHITKS